MTNTYYDPYLAEFIIVTNIGNENKVFSKNVIAFFQLRPYPVARSHGLAGVYHPKCVRGRGPITLNPVRIETRVREIAACYFPDLLIRGL